MEFDPYENLEPREATEIGDYCYGQPPIESDGYDTVADSSCFEANDADNDFGDPPDKPIGHLPYEQQVEPTPEPHEPVREPNAGPADLPPVEPPNNNFEQREEPAEPPQFSLQRFQPTEENYYVSIVLEEEAQQASAILQGAMADKFNSDYGTELGHKRSEAPGVVSHTELRVEREVEGGRITAALTRGEQPGTTAGINITHQTDDGAVYAHPYRQIGTDRQPYRQSTQERAGIFGDDPQNNYRIGDGDTTISDVVYTSPEEAQYIADILAEAKPAVVTAKTILQYTDYQIIHPEEHDEDIWQDPALAEQFEDFVWRNMPSPTRECMDGEERLVYKVGLAPNDRGALTPTFTMTVQGSAASPMSVFKAGEFVDGTQIETRVEFQVREGIVCSRLTLGVDVPDSPMPQGKQYDWTPAKDYTIADLPYAWHQPVLRRP